jgi:gliding motility-associated-like protein
MPILLKSRPILLLVFVVQLACAPALAQYTKLFDFGSKAAGANPNATPISDGTFLYGTTTFGGLKGVGVIYKVKLDGSGFTTLHEFDGTDGSQPISSLLYDGTFLYGTTYVGGANSQGAIYKIKPDGTAFETIFSFQYVATGGFPFGSLITDGTSLYGTTSQGGSGFLGTVFKINKDGTGHTKLVEFAGATNGSDPRGSLFYDGTFLYGMTQTGGSSDLGTIFKVRAHGAGGFVKLLDFTGSATGSNPLGSLISDGTFLYGLTLRGGSNNTGALFKIQPDGSNFLKFVDFSNGGIAGAGPKGSLVFDGTFLYGTTTQGGTNFAGTFFKIQPNGASFTKLLDMTGDTSGPNPEGTLLPIGTVMYGTRSASGGGRFGTLFSVNNDGSAFTTLYTFLIEANNPVGRPVSDGTSFYGLAPNGGLNDNGSIYKINPDGTGYTRVFDFERATSGARPLGSVIFDGTYFYGMTNEGGANNEGTIFRIKPNGTGYQNLLDFDSPVSGSFPNGSFISDGIFLYGMTAQGGTSSEGIIFKVHLDGTNFTVLRDLDYTTDGSTPFGTLIFDGTFLYGLTSSGGVNGAGTIFKIKTDGTGFVRLHEFDFPEGYSPRGSLTAIGTTLYGFTSSGGDTGDGSLFKINNDGSGFQVLLQLDGALHGSNPQGSLISVGSYLYGMTASGGLLNHGTLFRIKPDGTGYQKYLDFDDGNQPIGSLASDGTFLYGTTTNGGDFGIGTFFKVTVNPFTKVTLFEPTHGVPGTYVTIKGQGFDPVAANNVVSFNGEAAQVISGTTDTLVVIVPDAATDGPISVTANGTTDNTFDDFVVDTESEMFEGKVKTCGVTFVSPNTSDDLTQTFIPGTPGSKVRVKFTAIDIDDRLNIYDGPNSSSPLIKSSDDGITAGDEFVATSASGELTFVYTWLDASASWTADITCDGVVNAITIDTQPAATAVCDGKTATFTVAASGATNIQYEWQYSVDGVATYNDLNDGGGYSNTRKANLSVNTAGNFGGGFYRCRVSGNSVPTVTTNSAKLTVNAIPTAPLTSGPPVVACAPSAVNLSVSGGTNGQYSWYATATGGTAINGQTNSIFTTPVLSTTTTFYATITTNGCESSRTPVTGTMDSCDVITDLVVYNAVSPNGDGKNDTFIIENIDILTGKQKNKVRILNRWGDEVFSVSDYNNSDKVFKGTNDNGNKLPSGIYYYLVTFSDGSPTLSGYLELRN